MGQREATKKLEILKEMAKSLHILSNHYKKENIQLMPYPHGQTYLWQYVQLRTNVKEIKI